MAQLPNSSSQRLSYGFAGAAIIAVAVSVPMFAGTGAAAIPDSRVSEEPSKRREPERQPADLVKRIVADRLMRGSITLDRRGKCLSADLFDAVSKKRPSISMLQVGHVRGFNSTEADSVAGFIPTDLLLLNDYHRVVLIGTTDHGAAGIVAETSLKRSRDGSTKSDVWEWNELKPVFHDARIAKPRFVETIPQHPDLYVTITEGGDLCVFDTRSNSVQRLATSSDVPALSSEVQVAIGSPTDIPEQTHAGAYHIKVTASESSNEETPEVILSAYDDDGDRKVDYSTYWCSKSKRWISITPE